MFAYTRGLATATKAKEVLPLKGIKVLDMTRVLAGVSSFFLSFFIFVLHLLALLFFLSFLAFIAVRWVVWLGELGVEWVVMVVRVVRLVWWKIHVKEMEVLSSKGKAELILLDGKEKGRADEVERKMTIPWKMNDEQRTSSMGILRWPKRNRAHPTVLERDEGEILTPETAQTPHETFYWQNDHSPTAHKSSAI
jgi:hypothetical protein